ncbi:MAG: hypothetical protein ACRDVD_07100 [Acidimicrobiia bacterium]
MANSSVPDKVLAAGFTSIEDARTALVNLRARRERAIDERLSVSSLGGDDLVGGMRAEQWRKMNDDIDAATGVADLESQIARLEDALGDGTR